MRGAVEFEHVDFAYHDGEPVLKDFNLKIRQGESVALVGPTGGGKSTIVNLLCRFYEPTGGAIRLAGTDYTQLSLHGIQSRVGMVLQTPHLFSGSIRENIRYGRLDASDDEVASAAALAGADEFIRALEHGYDEDVGEGGNLLSVGQKQLISLSRAVLANPEIFIMDEATSSVDTLTEHLIQQGMEQMMADRTSLIIAHRLSTIKRADRISADRTRPDRRDGLTRRAPPPARALLSACTRSSSGASIRQSTTRSPAPLPPDGPWPILDRGATVGGRHDDRPHPILGSRLRRCPIPGLRPG